MPVGMWESGLVSVYLLGKFSNSYPKRVRLSLSPQWSHAPHPTGSCATGFSAASAPCQPGSLPLQRLGWPWQGPARGPDPLHKFECRRCLARGRNREQQLANVRCSWGRRGLGANGYPYMNATCAKPLVNGLCRNYDWVINGSDKDHTFSPHWWFVNRNCTDYMEW